MEKNFSKGFETNFDHKFQILNFHWFILIRFLSFLRKQISLNYTVQIISNHSTPFYYCNKSCSISINCPNTDSHSNWDANIATVKINQHLHSKISKIFIFSSFYFLFACTSIEKTWWAEKKEKRKVRGIQKMCVHLKCHRIYQKKEYVCTVWLKSNDGGWDMKE